MTSNKPTTSANKIKQEGDSKASTLAVPEWPQKTPYRKAPPRKPSAASKPKSKLVSKDCNCGQEEKVIILVGCTQHGKSSLIRSILDYGEYNTEADKVKIGSFGNKSTTKDVSSFGAVINIHEHFLKRIESGAEGTGKEDVIMYANINSEPEDLYDLIPDSKPSGRHIHIRMIDTPGLDDSDNTKDKVQGTGNLSQMRTVDEKHKFAVLKALANEKKIHAVCFLLSLENPLGNSTQYLLKEYIDIFEMSNLSASYHFAHTYISVDNMFESKARERPAIIEQTFGLRKSQVKHHRINNIPIDDIDRFFAHAAVTQFLSDIGQETGQATNNLRYPKSSAHHLMDHDLIQSFNILRRSWERAAEELDSKISSLDTSKARLTREINETWSDYKGTEAKITKANKKTDVVKGEIRRIRLRIRELDDERAVLSLKHIPMKTIKANEAYFGNPSVLCYVAGFQIKRTVSVYLLPGEINPRVTKLSKEYKQKISEFSKHLGVSTAMLSSIKADTEREAKLLTRLKEVKTTISEKIETERTKSSGQNSWQPKSNINDLRKDLQAEVYHHLHDLHTELKPRIDDRDSILLENLYAEEACLHRMMEVVQRGMEKIQKLIQENKKTREKWRELEADHRASREAANAINNFLWKGFAVMSIGVFTILREEIEQLGPESQEPWDRLFHNFKELYLCDPRRWYDNCWDYASPLCCDLDN